MKHIILAAAMAGAGAAASAATLNFSEVSPGFQGSTILALSNATLTSEGNDSFVGAPNQFEAGTPEGTYCAITNGSCEADFTIDFAEAVLNVMFETFVGGAGDIVEVTAFNEGAEVGSVSVASSGAVDLSGFGVVTSLFFDDSSTDAGFRYGNFSFDTVVAPIPLSASAGFILVGLGAFAVARKRG